MFCYKTGKVENKLPPGTPWAACSAGKGPDPQWCPSAPWQGSLQAQLSWPGGLGGSWALQGALEKKQHLEGYKPPGLCLAPPTEGRCWRGEDGWEQRCQRGLCVKNNNNNFHCFDVCTQLNANVLPERCLALGAGLGPEVSEPDCLPHRSVTACPSTASLVL